MIRANAHKYSISALCRCLGIARSTYYYECTAKKDETQIEATVQAVFNENRRVYGQRKLKHALARKGTKLSCRKIGRIMRKYGLVSVYTHKSYHTSHHSYNEACVDNLLNRRFNEQKINAFVVSDLTYVRVADKWGYVCILLELHSREIIGFSAGMHKDAELVRAAFSRVKCNLFDIKAFHTDRGSEFDNRLIDEMLDAFRIERSLSMKGCPYDNAVAESTFKSFKAEFAYRRIFTSIGQLNIELEDYVHWFNCIRLHGSLGYLPPTEYKKRSAL